MNDSTVPDTPPFAKLNSNENPWGPSPRAIAAASASIGQLNNYPPNNDGSLKAALAEFHGRGLTEQYFFSGNGGVEVLSLIEQTLLEPNSRSIVMPPCFGPYIVSLQQKGAIIDKVPLRDDTWEVQVEAVLKAVRPDTRLLYLTNPNNPTGSWFDETTLLSLLDRLPDHVTVIYDEVYYQFANDDPLPDAIKLLLEGRQLIIVHSFSKAYGLAGLRVGYGIGAPETVKRIEAQKRSFHLNAVAMQAAIAALKDTEHLSKTVAMNDEQRPQLIDGLRQLGLRVTPSQGNFVMFKCPDGQSAVSMTEALKAHRVGVRPAFHLSDQIRATVGTPAQNKMLISALAQIL